MTASTTRSTRNRKAAHDEAPAPVAAPKAVATEDEAAPQAATPTRRKGVQCSQFIPKRGRRCNMLTTHESGICTDHRWVNEELAKKAAADKAAPEVA